jgi:hypothetical protein
MSITGSLEESPAIALQAYKARISLVTPITLRSASHVLPRQKPLALLN